MGLMYYQARYYDPAVGTFISPDTIVPDATNVLDYNRFMYVSGRPLNMSDPSGHTGIERGPYINPGSNCYRWCGGAASMNPRRPDAETRQQMARAQQQADVAAGYAYGALEMVPYADTPNDVLVATTGCGYRCQAGYEEPAGTLGRVGAAAGILLPFGYRSLSVAADFGIASYKSLSKVLGTGSGLQRHHIIEKRFASVLGIENTDEMLSIVLTKEEHKVFTKAWKQWINYNGRGGLLETANATKDDIWTAAQDIYRDYPEMLDAARVTLFGE